MRKYKNFFNLRARKSHFLKYKKGRRFSWWIFLPFFYVRLKSAAVSSILYYWKFLYFKQSHFKNENILRTMKTFWGAYLLNKLIREFKKLKYFKSPGDRIMYSFITIELSSVNYYITMLWKWFFGIMQVNSFY